MAVEELNYITTRKFRRVLAQFRVSAHDLEIESVQYSGTARRERICKMCQRTIEDEFHFLFVCSTYLDLRQKYLPNDCVLAPYVFKFNKLLSGSNEQTLINLALYLFHTTTRRSRKLELFNDITNY